MPAFIYFFFLSEMSKLKASNAAAAATTTTPATETYALTSNDRAAETSSDNNRSKCSAFILRLTDASSKSLNETIAELKQQKSQKDVNINVGYVEIVESNGGAGNNEQGSLCFGGTRGVEHHFSIVDVQRDLGPSGQLQAVAQPRISSTKNHQHFGRMSSIGSVTKRVQILATTEDTIEKTKQKAKQVNEDMRKNTTKVLKAPATAVAGSGSSKKKHILLQNISSKSAFERPITPLSHSHSHQHRSSSPMINAGKTTTTTTAVNRKPSDPNDDSTRRVKNTLTYKPAPKRPVADSQQPRAPSISPKTAAAMDGISAVSISQTSPPPSKKQAVLSTRFR